MPVVILHGTPKFRASPFRRAPDLRYVSSFSYYSPLVQRRGWLWRSVELLQTGKSNHVVDGAAVARVEALVDVPSQRSAILFALLAVYVVWGSTYLAMHYALQGIPPLLMAGTRFTIAGALLYAFLRVRGEPAPTRAGWRAAAIVGALLLAGGNGVLAIGLELGVGTGLAALLVATVPLLSAIFSGLWGTWPTRREWLGIVAGFLGVAWLQHAGPVGTPAAGLVVLVAAASWAYGSIWSRRLPLPPGLMSSAAQMLAGGVLLLILGLARGERVVALPGTQALWALAYLVVFGSFVAYSSYLYLLRTVRPALATSYAYVNPVVAVGLGVAFAGESMDLAGFSAMLLTLGGVVLVLRR